MKKKMVLTSPVPQTRADMTFPDAMREVSNGKSVARKSWGNGDYVLIRGSWLTIYTKGDFHQFMVNDGDLSGTDWIIVPNTVN